MTAVQHAGVLEDTGLASALVGVAAVFRKESRDGILLKLLGALRVPTRLEGALTAPLIDVEAPEVDGVLGVAAVEVGCQVITGRGVIVVRIPDTEPAAVVFGLDELLAVADGGLDESGRAGPGDVVGDLVTGEETDDVAVLGHLVNDLGVALQVVEGPRRLLAVDGLGGGTEIGHDIDAGFVEQLHAPGVVRLGVDGIDTDGVGAGLLENGDISGTSADVGERVDVLVVVVDRCAVDLDALLVGDTLHEELGAIVGVEKVLALFRTLVSFATRHHTQTQEIGQRWTDLGDDGGKIGGNFVYQSQGSYDLGPITKRHHRAWNDGERVTRTLKLRIGSG